MIWLIAVGILFFGGGCAEQRIETKDIGKPAFFYRQKDMEEVVSYFVTSLREVNICNKKKIYRFDKIRNETFEHIDTKVFVKQFVSSFEKNGKCHFLEVEEKSANALFYGTVSAIYQKNELEKDMYYIFRLNLIDTKTGVLLWSDTKEIRKKVSRAIVGW